MSMAFLAAVLVSSFSSAAFATEPGLSDSCAEQRKRDPKKACTLAIEGSDLDGERISPNGDRLLARRDASFGSLIRYRTTMVDKLAKDTDRF